MFALEYCNKLVLESVNYLNVYIYSFYQKRHYFLSDISTGSVTTSLVITLQLEKPQRRKYLLISGIKISYIRHVSLLVFYI